MADPVNPFEKAQGIETLLKQQGVFSPSPLTREAILEQRQLVSGLPGLEPFDYASQLEEAQGMGKLQLALALAQRGFAAAGAPPMRGETPVSTLSRALLSPLAGDAGAVATQMMKQKQAAKLAERADKARLSQAALTMTQQHLAQEDVAQDKRFSLAKSLVERDYSPTKDLQRKVDGEWVDFVGFHYTDKVTNLPAIAGVDNSGNLKAIPFDELRHYRKPATVTPMKAVGSEIIDRIVQFPVRNPDGSVKEFRDVTVSQIRQIIPHPKNPTVVWGKDIFHLGKSIPLQIYDARTGEYRNLVEGIDFIGTDKDSWDTPVENKYYIKPLLSNTEFAAARNLLGENLERGEGVQRWTFRHSVNKEQIKFWYDVKGRRVDLTPELANKYLTTVKPTIKEGWPAGGKAHGNTTREFTVVTDPETGDTEIVTAGLWQHPEGILRWKEVGKDGKYLSDKYTGQIWGSLREDKLWRTIRPVLDGAFQSAVELRTELDANVREALVKQVLTTAELKRLAPIADESKRNRVINDIINVRVDKLLKKQAGTTAVLPGAPAVLPGAVLEPDPRVSAMTTVPKPSEEGALPVVNPVIFRPWTQRTENIQLGHGSHKGFTQQVTVSEVEEGRRNWPTVQRAFNQVYGGTKPLGDAEETVLMFSGLWKNLPGVAEGQKVITLRGERFRDAFDKAMGLYNAASTEYKAAAAINIGKGAQAKNLQAALDDDSDALRDNMIMLRFKDQAGAWFLTGTWLAEMRGTGLGELWEAFSAKDGTAMPSAKWADIAKPDDQLSAEDLTLKKEALAYLNARNKERIGLTEFERAAEYLGALNRYKIRAFQMISDSRPSDNDIKILLGAFVAPRDAVTTVFAKLHELHNLHVKSISRWLNQGISLKAKYDARFLVNLDHTSRALNRAALRDVDLGIGGRASETALLFRRSAETIRRAVEAASGRITPGHRGGRISAFSGNVDEESTANIYRRVLSAAKEIYPEKDDQEAVAEFVRQGLHLEQGFFGVFGKRRPTTPPAVYNEDGTITIP